MGLLFCKVKFHLSHTLLFNVGYITSKKRKIPYKFVVGGVDGNFNPPVNVHVGCGVLTSSGYGMTVGQDALFEKCLSVLLGVLLQLLKGLKEG